MNQLFFTFCRFKILRQCILAMGGGTKLSLLDKNPQE